MLAASHTREAEERARLALRRKRQGSARPAAPCWAPQLRLDGAPTPQWHAYHSAADVIGYGGAAGGGKSDLLLGLAGTAHRRSIIFRRVFPSLAAMIERSREIFARGESHARDSFNESMHRWRLADDRMIEFRAVQYESDLRKYQGQPHDLIGIDEATEFPEYMVRFLSGWNRTTIPGQRCRIVMTFNPPLEESGNWIVQFFGPWLDPEHPSPAADGALRYVVRHEDRDQFYAALDDVPEAQQEALAEQAQLEGHGDWRRMVKTRTFFHASLADNPILAATGYGATIEALPEPLRSLLKGNFGAARVADPWQVIPAGWVRAAQARWRERWQDKERWMRAPLSGVGVDVARGGQDRFVIAKLHGTWCAPLEGWPGSVVPDGPSGAGLVLQSLEGETDAPVGVDVIGVGSSVYDSLQAAGIAAIPVNNSEGAPDARDRSEKLRFRNVRAASYWALREALDPIHGDGLALPDDPELLADLCAPRYKVSTAGVTIESKDDIKARIGRSPDKGDALVIAHWVVGQGSWLVWGG